LLLLLSLSFTGCPEIDDFGFQGPMATDYLEFGLQDATQVSVYYPKSAPPAQGYPLVVFSTGWNQVRSAYLGYARQLAEWGFVVAVRYYPSLGVSGIGDDYMLHHLAQLSETLDRCAAMNADPQSPLHGLVDVSNAGAAGHSMGGVVSVLGSLYDSRIRAVVSMDGNHADAATDAMAPSLDGASVPMMFLQAELGGFCTENPLARYAFFDAVEGPAARVMLLGADHMDYMDEDGAIISTLGRYLVCPDGTASAQLVRELATRYMTAWFGVHLKGDASFRTHFDGQRADEDEALGLVAIDLKPAS
jgi:dienelactone hydrolase